MKKLGILLTAAFLLTGLANGNEPSAGQQSQAKWIWYPEVGLKDQLRFFRREFTLPEKPAAGTLNFSGDDVYTIWINGQKVHKAVNFKCPPFDAAKYLKKGKNVIAAEVLNIVSGAGLLMRTEIRLPGQQNPVVWVTDSSWKCSKTNAPGWTDAGFNDSSWRDAMVVRGVTDQHSWRKHIDLRRFLSRQEYEQYTNSLNTTQVQTAKLRGELLKRLAQEAPAARTEVRRINGYPWISSGSWSFPAFLYNSVMLNTGTGPESHLARFGRFYQAGFRLFVTQITLETLWKENAAPDFAAVENGLLNLLAHAPDARLVIMIDLNPPEWYVRRHPEELIRYGSGAKPVFAGDHLRNPMMRPSMASKSWMKECGSVVADIVRRLEQSPAAKRIVAYMPFYGIYSEWHYYGMPKDLPDTGSAMTAAFREFLHKKYGSDEALRRAWLRKDVSLATAQVPVRERLNPAMPDLRDPAADRCTLDYLECHAAVINDCQAYFNRTVRNAADGRVLTGNYSGYFFGMGYPAEGWQTHTPEMLRSGDVDFQAAPYSYRFRSTGDCGLPRNVFETYALNGKFSILESDARTHLSGDPNDGHSHSLADSVGQLTRDFCNAATRGSGLWYYDFTAGWYDRPEYLSLFSGLLKIMLEKPDTTRRSEVAFVCDFDSVPYHTRSVNPNEFSQRLTSFTARELFYSGVPFDTVLWQDLQKTDHKIYIFANSFHLTPEKQAMIDQLRAQGKTLIFLYAAGALPDSGVNADGMEKFTGIRTRLIRQQAAQTIRLRTGRHPFVAGLEGKTFGLGLAPDPFFEVDDPEAEILGNIIIGGRKFPALAVKQIGDSQSVYCAIPFLSRNILRNIFRASGVHIYLENNEDVLFASSGLIGLHTAKGGMKELRLPESAAKITQLLPERKEFPAGKEIRFRAKPAETALFKLEN